MGEREETLLKGSDEESSVLFCFFFFFFFSFLSVTSVRFNHVFQFCGIPPYPFRSFLLCQQYKQPWKACWEDGSNC